MSHESSSVSQDHSGSQDPLLSENVKTLGSLGGWNLDQLQALKVQIFTSEIVFWIHFNLNDVDYFAIMYMDCGQNIFISKYGSNK